MYIHIIDSIQWNQPLPTRTRVYVLYARVQSYHAVNAVNQYDKKFGIYIIEIYQIRQF